MSISDGVDANAANFNSSFVSKTDADSKGGDLTLNDKLSLQDSGSATMTDAQQEINDLKDEFNSSTGHDHDGVNSKKVVASNLDGTGGSNGQVLKADGAGNVLWDTDEGTGAINYIGAWNANTNSPALASGAGTKGDYYVVNVAGTTTLDGISDWENTDWAVFNGTAWEKVDNTDQVLSVAGKQGAVVLDSDDVTETASKKWAFKSNLTTSDPTTTDDSASGYSVGSRWWNSSSDTLFICEDNTASAAVWKGVSGGAGGGGLDVYLAEDFETTVATDFTSGNNATFDNGGTLQGTLADETTNPIAGSSCLKYTQAAGSLNDFIKSPVINIDEKQAGNYTGMTLYFTYDGDADDIKVIFYDETNSEVLTDSVDLLSSESNPTRYSTSVFIPEGVTQVAYGFQVAVENSTKILLADDVELTTNPFVYKDLIETGNYHVDTHAGYGSTANKIPYFTNVNENDLGNFGTITNDSTNGLSFTAIKECSVTMTYSAVFSAAGAVGISLNASSVTTSIALLGSDERIAHDTTSAGNFNASATACKKLQAGDVIRPHTEASTVALTGRHHVVISAVATTEHVITPAKSNANVFSARIANSGTATIVSQGEVNNIDQNAIASVNRISTGTVDITFATDFFSITPSVTFGSEANTYNGFITSLSTSGCTVITTLNTTGANGDQDFSLDLHRQGNDVKDSSFLAAIPTQLTAYIKDIKSDGTDGGTFTSGAWQTRDLNTLEGDSSFVTLSSNQFTLPPGKYEIEAKAPALGGDDHKIKLYNATDAIDEIIGSSGYSRNSSSNQTDSLFVGKIEITTSKTFEIRHRCQTTVATFGFGTASTFGVDEIYTQVKITKVK